MERLGICPWLVKSCNSVSIFNPTEIQRRVIPLALSGKNVIGQSQTGSGKTACYSLPILQQLAADVYGVFALVIVPSRELAYQAAEQFWAFGSSIQVRVSIVVGGEDMMKQSQELSSAPHVVIATPGRILDHLASPNDCIKRRFRHIKVLVCDEVDRLIDDSILPDLVGILSNLPDGSKRQTLLFSATIFGDTEKLCRIFLLDNNNNMAVINVNTNHLPVEDIKQYYVFIPSTVRVVYLVYLLRTTFVNSQGIIFTSRCEYCEHVTTTLEVLGFSVTTLHSLQSQRTRKACLAKFRSETCKILVATDVASRGLDIPKMGFVVNLDMPWSVKDYIHRIGRTGRAGRKGTAISFISERPGDAKTVIAVEKLTGIALEMFPLVEKDVLKGLNEVTKAQKEATLTLHGIKKNHRRIKNNHQSDFSLTA